MNGYMISETKYTFFRSQNLKPLNMRKPTDLCLLCGRNAATKTNSHIFPRFISTEFLGKKGTPRRGFTLDSSVKPDKKPRVTQDSPKENYILCEECESYFSVLGSYSAGVFNNWKEKVRSGEFYKTTVNADISVINFITADPAIIRLFIYSIFWRAGISSHYLFEDYKLDRTIEKELRNILLSFKSLKF